MIFLIAATLTVIYLMLRMRRARKCAPYRRPVGPLTLLGRLVAGFLVMCAITAVAIACAHAAPAPGRASHTLRHPAIVCVMGTSVYATKAQYCMLPGQSRNWPQPPSWSCWYWPSADAIPVRVECGPIGGMQ